MLSKPTGSNIFTLYFLECSIPSCSQCVTFDEFCSVQCNGTLVRRHRICQQCEGNLQAKTYEDTTNCKLDDGKNGCISNSDQTTIQYEPAVYGSGIHEVKTFSPDENNLQESLPSESLSGSIFGSTEIQQELPFDSAFPMNDDTLICQNCDLGFALSDDLLSCIGE